MQFDISSLSHIGRTLDWNYPSNRRIILFSLAVVLVIGSQRLLTGVAFVQAAIQAIGAGGFSFAAWAIGREIDPDHDLSAFIGAVLIALALIVWPLPWIFPVWVLAVLLRVVNWTYGLPPLWSDYLGVIAVVVISVALHDVWPLGTIAALGLALNALLPRPQRPLALIFAGLTLALTLVASLLTPANTLPTSPEPPYVALAILTTLLYLAAILLGRKTFDSVGDVSGEALIPARIQAGRGLALLAALALFAFYGSTGFIALLPAWAAMLGIGLRFLVRRH